MSIDSELPLEWLRMELRFPLTSADGTVADPDAALDPVVRLVERIEPVEFLFVMSSDGTDTCVQLAIGVAAENANALQLIRFALVRAEGVAGFNSKELVGKSTEGEAWDLARIDFGALSLQTGEEIALIAAFDKLLPGLASEAFAAGVPFGYRASFKRRTRSPAIGRKLIRALAQVRTHGQMTALDDALDAAVRLQAEDGWAADEAICLPPASAGSVRRIVEAGILDHAVKTYPFLDRKACRILWAASGSHSELGDAPTSLQSHVGAARAKEYPAKVLLTSLAHARRAGSRLGPSGPPPAPISKSPTSGPSSRPQGDFVFISYSHGDAHLADRVVESLEGCGLRVWLDRNILPGSVWEETLETRIRDCTVFVPCVSANYEASRFCRKEIKFANLIRKPIVPIGFGAYQWGWGLQLVFQELQILSSELDPNFSRAVEAIRGVGRFH